MTSVARGSLEPAPTSFLDARLQLARLEVSDAHRLERILEHATRLSATQLGVERVGIWLFDPPGTTLTLCLLYEQSKEAHSRPLSPIFAATIPEYVASIDKRRVFVIEDARTHSALVPIVSSYLEPNGIGSLLDAPIFRQGKLFGVVCHEHVGGPRVWTLREIDFAASVADMVALYFEEAEAAYAHKRLSAQERELNQAERLASVGLLARHVAHDLNNAVAPILMCGAQLRNALASDPKLRERVNIIMDAAEHGGALAKRLLRASAGGPASTREAVSLDPLISDALPLLKAIAGDDVKVELHLDAPAADIQADPVELMRALINLVTNARDAMPEGGTVTIATRRHLDSLVLEVRDSGQGMTVEQKEHLFEPFFTTKPGRGSGLGLTGVQSMIEGLHGEVEVVSAPGDGTTITLTFRNVSDADAAP